MARAFTGPLCRFFAGERGEPMTFVQGVDDWRKDLQSAFAKDRVPQFHWQEDPSVAASWFDLGDSGWIALRLFAFYAEKSDLELPDTAPALIELDRDWREVADQKFARSKYAHLLAARMWFPQDFAFTARIALPDGDATDLGSLAVLRDQLRWLNARTFQADEEQVAEWIALEAPAGGALIQAAQRGYAALWNAVEDATQRRVPLVLVEA
jgi:hypothetical protein